MFAAQLSESHLKDMARSKAHAILCFTGEEWCVYRHRYLQLQLQQKGLLEKTYADAVHEFYHRLAYTYMQRKYRDAADWMQPLLRLDTRFIWHPLNLANQLEMPGFTCVAVTGKGVVW